MKKKADQREHNRFKVRTGAGAALNESKIGAIANISRGGLALTYIDLGDEDKKGRQGPPQISIVHEDGFSLENVPCKILGEDGSPSQNLYSSVNINQCRIQFGQLTPEQKAQLENFLNYFTDSPIPKH
jgi:hypothetical protein